MRQRLDHKTELMTNLYNFAPLVINISPSLFTGPHNDEHNYVIYHIYI